MVLGFLVSSFGLISGEVRDCSLIGWLACLLVVRRLCVAAKWVGIRERFGGSILFRMHYATAIFVCLLLSVFFPSAAWSRDTHRSSRPLEASEGAARRLLAAEDGVGSQSIQTVLVVSNDGHPNHFASVQMAVDAVPMWNYLRWVIYIKPGTYYGPVIVPEGKDYITFLGEGAESTVLTFNRKACDRKPDGQEYTILDCPSVIVEGSYFVAKGITFENSAPKPVDFDYNSQAPAIRVSGDNCAFYSCSFLGWQDTLYADQGRQYYKDCRVEGNVDFILGYACAVFENCTIYSRGEGFITAQSRWCDDNCLEPSNSTFVILRSNVTGYDLANYQSTGTGLTYLGRPWREYARVVVIDTALGQHIAPEGWVDWLTDSGPLFAHDHVYFAEFNSSGPGANATARIPWSHQLTAEEVDMYRDAQTFLEGESWLEVPPTLEELRESDLLQEKGWMVLAAGWKGYKRNKFPPRRWKRLNGRAKNP